MEIKKIGENIEFTLKLFFCKDGEIKKWAINLMSEISSNVPTDKDEFIVQYPGEYEKDGIYILAIEGNAQKLSYFVFDYNENTSFAFLQDGEILENLETIKHPEEWFFQDENVESQLDKLWFEGERKLIWKDHEVDSSEEEISEDNSENESDDQEDKKED